MQMADGLRSLAATLWLALLLCLSPPAHALGFGALILSSHLNEKLKAEVPLILNASDDINTVRIGLAGPADYRQAGLAWQPQLARIKVFIQDKQSPRPQVLLRSAGVIDATMLSILLKAQKEGRGTYYKHFQLLLDPVEMTGLRPLRPSVTALRSASDHNDSPAAQTDTRGWARVWRYGPVRAGDSLSEIAYRLRRDKRFSNRQVMLSLYKQNPQGFVGGDINQLKQGAWLDVPRGEVVKRYGGKAAMRTLSALLTRHRDDGAASPAASRKTVPAATAKTAPKQSAQQQHSDQELRYSGKIAINSASATPSAAALKTVQESVDKQFDAMHAEMMAGKLQMTDLGKSVAAINQSVRAIKQDIHALKKDVAMMKNRPSAPAGNSLDNWQIILFALLAGLLGALLAIKLQRKPAAPRAAETNSKQSGGAGRQEGERQPGRTDGTPKEKLNANTVVQLLNQAEEHLGRCEYEQAGQMLAQVEQYSPDSLRAAALKAQLLHETDRLDARNALINRVSDISDKQGWEDFCNLLPSHVWNACFGSDASHADAHDTAAADVTAKRSSEPG